LGRKFSIDSVSIIEEITNLCPTPFILRGWWGNPGGFEFLFRADLVLEENSDTQSGCPDSFSPARNPIALLNNQIIKYNSPVNLMGRARTWGPLGKGAYGWRGFLLTSFYLPFLPFRASPFSTWGLEVLGRSPFIRPIIKHGTGYALINGRIVMHTQAEGTKMEKKGGDRPVERRDSTNAGGM